MKYKKVYFEKKFLTIAIIVIIIHSIYNVRSFWGKFLKL